ncbi:MAG: triphosphoribosyl-dephospho-CoA synthase CitG [Lachnospiraceae bacterium]|nr:triphosphoribosyl-dephospho-CoA synthase CitG [Lachnospiraceae bacterium]
MDSSPLYFITDLFEYALMAEVSATPKPGLVDRHDSGAHKDMNYDTFAASAAAIAPYLTQMACMGYRWEGKSREALFQAIRPIGVLAERSMFEATGNVNTHKGMIFSMGTIAAASGLYYRIYHKFSPEKILLMAGQMCSRTLEQDFAKINGKNPRTHGELLYLRYGSKGIRGEAQKGFPSIREISLPALRKAKAEGLDDNEAHLNTLLALMTQVDDTNVLIRTNPSLLNYEKAEAAHILRLGGAATPKGMDALRQLNEAFIKLNISPGGCADLLAVTIFLYQLEQRKEPEA